MFSSIFVWRLEDIFTLVGIGIAIVIILALCISFLISRIGEKITKKKWEDEDE
jgi:hypothetical protein